MFPSVVECCSLVPPMLQTPVSGTETCLPGLEQLGCPKLVERIPIPSFMLVTLKSIKIEGFQGRKKSQHQATDATEDGFAMSKGCWETHTPFNKYIGHCLETIYISHLLCVWRCTASKFRDSWIII